MKDQLPFHTLSFDEMFKYPGLVPFLPCMLVSAFVEP